MRWIWTSLAVLAVACPAVAQADDAAALLQFHDKVTDLRVSAGATPAVSGQAALHLSVAGMSAQLTGSAHSAGSEAPLSGTSGQNGAAAQLDTDWTHDRASLHLHAEHKLDESVHDGATAGTLYVDRSVEQDASDRASAIVTVKAAPNLTVQAAAETGDTETVQSQWLNGTASDSRVQSQSTGQSLNAKWAPVPHAAVSAGASASDASLQMQGSSSAQVRWQALEPHAALTVEPFDGAKLTLGVDRSVQPVGAGNLAAWRAASGTDANANGDLKPDTSDEFTAALHDSVGPLSLGAHYATAQMEATTVIGQGREGQSPVTVSGGRRQSASVTIAMALDGLGLRGLALSSHAVWRDSHIIDPVTGADRGLSGEVPHDAEIKLSQDLPARHLSFGLTGSLGAQTHYYQLAVDTTVTRDPSAGAYIEYHPGPFSLKLDVTGLGGGISRDDAYYAGSRAGLLDHVGHSQSGSASIGLTLTKRIDG